METMTTITSDWLIFATKVAEIERPLVILGEKLWRKGILGDLVKIRQIKFEPKLFVFVIGQD